MPPRATLVVPHSPSIEVYTHDGIVYTQWTKDFTGTFFSRMSFQAYPFDRQALRLTLVGDSLTFVPVYAVAMRHGRYKEDEPPEDIQGWTISRVAALLPEKTDMHGGYVDPVPLRVGAEGVGVEVWGVWDEWRCRMDGEQGFEAKGACGEEEG